MVASPYSRAELCRGRFYCRVPGMKKLAPVFAVFLALGACSKDKGKEPATTAPDPASKADSHDPNDPAYTTPKAGPTAAAADPAKLPPPGQAPPALTVGKEVDPM